jgi:hypothetical protein
MSLNFEKIFQFSSLIEFGVLDTKFLTLNLTVKRSAGPLILNLQNKTTLQKATIYGYSRTAGQVSIYVHERINATLARILDTATVLFTALHANGSISATITNTIFGNFVADHVAGSSGVLSTTTTVSALFNARHANGVLDTTTTVSAYFRTLHANGVLDTTTALSSNFIAFYIAGIPGNLVTTTANTTGVFSAHSTTYGTFNKILPSAITTNIVLKFIWFFTTIDIKPDHPLLAQFLLSQDPLISFNLTGFTTSINVIGTVPLRYFVTLFSYTYPLIVVPPITGIVYPAGNIDLKNTTVALVRIFGRVPEPIAISLNPVLSNSAFNSSGIALIGVNLIPFTNTLLTRFFIRVDLPINVTLSSIFYCSTTFYGHAQNYGSLSANLVTLSVAIQVLVPIYIQGTFTSELKSFTQNPWIGLIELCGSFTSSFYDSIISLVGICQIQGTLSKPISGITVAFVLERKDNNIGTISSTVSNLTVSTSIYIQGHSLLRFNATLPNTLIPHFSGLNTKVGVIIDIRNNSAINQVSFTGPVFKCTAYIQGTIGDNYPIRKMKFWKLQIFSNCGNPAITTFNQIKLFAKKESGEIYNVFENKDTALATSSGIGAENGLDEEVLWVAKNTDYQTVDGMYWQFALPEELEIISYEILGLD